MRSNAVTDDHYGSSRKFVFGRGVRLLLSLLLVLPASAYCADSKASKCMAEICLETPVTQEDMVAKYGPGREYVQIDLVETGGQGRKYVRKPNPDSVKRCYYDPKQDLYIEFSFDKHQQQEDVNKSDLIEIMVSSVPMCPKTYTPKLPFPAFKTELGVGVGATEAEVSAAMGKPHSVRDMAKIERARLAHSTHEKLVRTYGTPDYGETALFYNPDPQHELLFNSFYISHGKVKSIHMSASE